MRNSGVIQFTLLGLCLSAGNRVLAMSESERMEQYAARNYTWPLSEFMPNTPGWTALMQRRIQQVEALNSSSQHKWDAWLSVMSSAVTSPNFTRYGWGVTRGPQYLLDEFQQTLRENFENAVDEGEDIAIVGKYKSAWFVPMPELIEKALIRLQSYNEAFSGIPLQPQQGYGLRLYRNTSALYMHLDKPSTHVISSIFHIDRSSDAEPWPLVIEDFEGVVQNVYLEKGDILFYESSKCLHGRPIPFEGTWYTSLFLHYYPKENWIPDDRILEPQYAVPEHWLQVKRVSSDDYIPRLEMVDTAMIEPDCPNKWCLSSTTSDFSGPAVPGIIMTSQGMRYKLNAKDVESQIDEL